MSVKQISSLFCEGIGQDPNTLQTAFVGVRTSLSVAIAYDSGYADFEIPPLTAVITFARTDEASNCDDRIAIDAFSQVLFDDGEIAPGYEKPSLLTVRIGPGQITSSEMFNLPGFRFRNLPEHEITRRSWTIVITAKDDGRELGRAVMRFLFDRRYALDPITTK